MTTKSYYRLLLFFCLLLLLTQLSAQQPTANPSEGFKLFFEKVYLHLDRTYYSSGDDIWFKAYLVNGQTNRPLNTSNNLYVELVDPNASIVSRIVIRLDSAAGIGDFKLDDSVATGTYRVRAYTNWMRNFGNHFVFEKEIQVSNLPAAGGGNSSLAKTERKEQKENRVKKAANASAYKVQFFPESGAMIEDVPTVVAFKAEDANGSGVDANGYIQTANGARIISFATTHAGMGSFAFTPRKNEQYKIMVQYRNNSFTEVPFPSVLPTGYVMNVSTADTANIVVNIRSNEATTKLLPSGIVNIAARHAGKSYFKQQAVLKNGAATLSIPTKDFPEGIAYITLYDEGMRPYCERLAYVEKKNDLLVSVSPDKQAYNSKEKASVAISLRDAEGRPVKADLSFAAVDDKMDKKRSGNIQSYLLLESDLPGKIENPEAYFDKSNGKRRDDLDLLLRAQGWRSFLWRQIADTNLRISYLPEAGVTVSGTVTKPWSKKGLQGMNVTLFAPDARGDKIYTTKTNQSGKYFLDGLPLFGVQSVKLNVGDAVGKTIGAIAMDSLYNKPLPVTLSPYEAVDTSAAMTAFTAEANKRWSIFRKTNLLPGVTITTKQASIKLEDGTMTTSFGYPEYDFDVTAKDYQYQSLQDFLVQKVPGAMYDEDLDGVNFLSNGKRVRPTIRIDNREEIFGRLDYYHLPLQQVESIRVRHMVGSRPHTGYSTDEESFSTTISTGIKDYFLINLKIKPGAADQQLSKITTSVTGYYESRMFYAPNYSAEDATKQDERITIHWSPFVKIDENGKATINFYNADPKGKIRLTVQGLTNDGVPVVASAVYEVK